MRIVADITRLKKGIDAEIARGQRAVRGGIAEATVDLKAELRRQVVSAGLGARLSKTWRDKVKPAGPSLDASGWVWSKAPHIIRGFATGALIRARGGSFLAVPLRAAGKGPRGTRITPAAWEKRTGKKLRFVPRRGRKPLLVTDAGTGGFTRSGTARTSKRAGRATIPVFVLILQVKLPRVLAPERSAAVAVRAVPKNIEARWKAA